MKEFFYISTVSQPEVPRLSRRQRKIEANSPKSLDSYWGRFLVISNYGLGNPGVALYSSTKGLLAYSLEREGFPKGDMFDRMRVRVTGAMPPAFRAKIISEMKSGVRHMRDF